MNQPYPPGANQGPYQGNYQNQPPPPPQGFHAPPPGYGYPPYYQEPLAPIMSVKDWVITFLLLLIPIFNIIMIFIWAFGDGNPNKQNFFKAQLLLMGIILGIYLLIFLFGVFILASAF